MHRLHRLLATSTAAALLTLSCGATYAIAEPTASKDKDAKVEAQTSSKQAKDQAQTTTADQTTTQRTGKKEGAGQVTVKGDKAPGPDPKSSSGSEQVESAISPTKAATELVGSGITVSNAKYTGSANSIGTFSGFGGAKGIGIDSGVALSTGSLDSEDGRVSSILMPNSSTGASGNMQADGDAELTKIAGDETHDASVLEFDFTSTTAKVRFSYVFGSEEYPEYVNQYNDVFALDINGKNCALIPGTDDAVTINNVNADKNSKYFRNNYDDTAKYATQLDGLTTVLRCNATVTPGAKNHIKLAIADTSDSIFDSAVLIKAKSVQAQVPPVAQDQTYYYSTEGSAPKTTTTLKATDANPDDVLTYSVIDQPKHGSLSGTEQKLVYTPNKPAAGDTYVADSFTYKANDGTDDSKPATVTLKPNTKPAVKDESYTTKFQTELKINKADGVLANDSAGDPGQSVTVSDYQQPKHGKVSVGSDGHFSYTPDQGFSGADSFKYSVTDGIDTIDPVATIKVLPNDPPVGKADHYKTAHNTKLRIKAPLAGLLANDSDPDNDKLTTPKHSKPEQGKVKLFDNGTFRYTPKDGFSGTDTFTYRLSDGYHTSAPITVTIKVAAPVNAKDSTSTGAQAETKHPKSDHPKAEVEVSTGSPTSIPQPTESTDGPAATTGALASTGSEASPAMIGVGVGALIAGLGTVIAARRVRRR